MPGVNSFSNNHFQNLERRAKDREKVETSGASGRSLHILVVDDVEENNLVTQAYLKNSQHTLEIAENGAQALEKFKKGGYDLILMDIQMPVMDGYEATMKIRAWESEYNLNIFP